MFSELGELMRAYPGAFWATVVLPVVVALVALGGAAITGYSGFETLKGRLAASQASVQLQQKVDQLLADSSTIQSKIQTLSYYDQKLIEAGKRDKQLGDLITQYQHLSRAAVLFGEISRHDSSKDQGAIAAEILKILSQDILRIQVRNDLPGKPLIIELEPNTFRVIYPVPMRAPPELTFSGLPVGVSPHVLDKSTISFTVTFLPLSIPVKTFGAFASAEL